MNLISILNQVIAFVWPNSMNITPLMRLTAVGLKLRWRTPLFLLRCFRRRKRIKLLLQLKKHLTWHSCYYAVSQMVLYDATVWKYASYCCKNSNSICKHSTSFSLVLMFLSIAIRGWKTMVVCCREQSIWIHRGYFPWAACFCKALPTFWRMYVTRRNIMHSFDKCTIFNCQWRWCASSPAKGLVLLLKDFLLPK